ncbi:MAG: hypothetical protein M1457_09595 [bacterium]|nr:hypothetical protein [bacterium]
MAITRSQPSLADYLVREGIISQAQLNEALENQRSTARSVGRILVDKGFITEGMRMTVLQKRFGYPLVRLKDTPIASEVLALIPYSFAEKHRVVPVRVEGKTLVVAMEDPSDMLVVDAIENQVGLALETQVASQEDIRQVLDHYQTGVPAVTARHHLAPVWDHHPQLLKVLQPTAFPVLALAPLVVASILFFANTFGWQEKLAKWIRDGVISGWDIGLYTALVWGLWAMVLFEINGLVFGEKEAKEKEERKGGDAKSGAQ